MKINKVNAVVTGGGSGLGEGTAKYLKDKGANVFLIDVNEENLKKDSSDLDAEYFVGDVSDPDLMTEAIGNLENISRIFSKKDIFFLRRRQNMSMSKSGING